LSYRRCSKQYEHIINVPGATGLIQGERHMRYAVAEAVVAAAVKAASEKGTSVAAVVVDNGGHVVASARMDGCNFLAFGMATRKAVTSGVMGAPTAFLAERMAADPIIHNALLSDPNIVLLGGGLPIMIDGALAGGLGVSGGHYAMDMEVADAAIAAAG
jgi:glc operon protein GlcG